MPKIILSSDQHIDYLFYIPITSYVCEYFGFKPVVIILGESKFSDLVYEYTKKYTTAEIVEIESIPPFKDATIVQFSRLYAACLEQDENEYLITGDIDMLILNKYLYRDFDRRNLYGYDLTSYFQFPICYIGMQCKDWRQLLNLEHGKFIENMKRDLEEEKTLAASDVFQNYWFTDQRFITKKIKQFGLQNFQIINRGTNKGCALKRIDRIYDWSWNINPGEDHIDCHLLKEGYKKENFDRVYNIIQMKVENVEWMKEYFEKFNNLK
jgi:hypothetical protein